MQHNYNMKVKSNEISSRALFPLFGLCPIYSLWPPLWPSTLFRPLPLPHVPLPPVLPLYPLPWPSAAFNRPLSPLRPCVPSTALYPSTEAKQHTYLFSEMFRKKRVSSKTLCYTFKNKFKHLFYMEKLEYHKIKQNYNKSLKHFG